MKSCEDYQEMISRMLDNDLNQAERAELAGHVKRCPDCAAAYVAFRSLSEHLGGELEEPPHRIRENVMAEVRRDRMRKKNSVQRSHHRWHTVLTVAACLVLVAAAGFALPQIVGMRTGRAAEGADHQEAAVVEATTAEEAPMQAAPQMPEAARSADDDSLFDMEKNDAALYGAAAAAEDTGPQEAAGFSVAPAAATEDDPLVLDEEQSEALQTVMSYTKVPLAGVPDRELYLVYLVKGQPQKLTVFLLGSEAVYVYADGDSYCLFNVSADELLRMLGLPATEKTP